MNFQSLSRRSALLTCFGFAATTTAAWALDDPEPALVPRMPSHPPSTLPTPIPAMPVSIPGLNNGSSAASDAIVKSLGTIDKRKSYYLFFQQQIDPVSIKNLRTAIITLVEADVTDITLVINSNGGLVAPSLALSNLMVSLPSAINTHGQGFVHSAATLLFLSGKKRTADRNVQFLFHPSQSPIFGTFTNEQMEDQMRLISFFGQAQANLLRERTTVPESDIDDMSRKTVIYTAEQALKYGIIESIGPMQTPKGDKCKFVFFDGIL